MVIFLSGFILWAYRWLHLESPHTITCNVFISAVIFFNTNVYHFWWLCRWNWNQKVSLWSLRRDRTEGSICHLFVSSSLGIMVTGRYRAPGIPSIPRDRRGSDRSLKDKCWSQCYDYVRPNNQKLSSSDNTFFHEQIKLACMMSRIYYRKMIGTVI